MEASGGVEVVEQCRLGFFNGGFAEGFGFGIGGFFGAVESRVLGGFKPQVKNVEFPEVEHAGYGVVF